MGTEKEPVPSAPLNPINRRCHDTQLGGQALNDRLVAALERWQGSGILPGARPCRVFASLPSKILPGTQPSVFCLLDNLALASSYPPAGLAAGMATTVRAQVWGTKKTQTLVHRHTGRYHNTTLNSKLNINLHITNQGSRGPEYISHTHK